MGNVNTIGNKYLGVTDNSIMFLTKGSTNIMTRLESSDENLYKFFSVNDSGKKIMESIDGSATINDFIKNFCENYNLEYETNKGWIAAFIMEMIQKKALKLSEIPMDNSKVLLQGSEDTISPVHATIEITEKCNLKCKHCYLEAGICKTSMIDYDRFEKLVDEMVANHVLNVEITGGEIFMHPRVLDILKLCYKKFAMLGILTNGTIMTDEVLELIAENKMTENMQADSVQSRQVGFVRCCLNKTQIYLFTKRRTKYEHQEDHSSTFTGSGNGYIRLSIRFNELQHSSKHSWQMDLRHYRYFRRWYSQV